MAWNLTIIFLHLLLPQQRLQFNVRDHPGFFRTPTNTPNQIMSLKTGCPFSKEASSHVKKAGILIIGDEILKGQVMDTNSHFVCKELYSYGVKVARIAVISDSIEEISKEVRKFSSRYDYVITTGGIGPTHDDMTYAGVAKAFGEPVTLHDDMAVMVDKWLAHRGYDRDVLQRMAELPASAKLLFDANLPLASFPIVIVRNVYIFPGVPQFVEKMFPRLARVFRTELVTFHSREIHVAKDEMSITSQINKAVDKFKDTVTFGSYPVYDNLYYSTRLTMESLSADYVQKANDYLTGLMPPNTVVKFDKNAVPNASANVYAIVGDTNHELHQIVAKAVKVIEEALEKFQLENLCICFNGGKDCTALLHLFHAVIQKKFPGTNIKIQSLYIKGDNPFEEMETFIEQTTKRYLMKTWTFNAPIKNGLTNALKEHKELKGVLMGTRRSDPSGETLGYFQMTDAGWPQIMRISPMLDWSFSDVWTFLRSLTLPYCPLYDRGSSHRGGFFPCKEASLCLQAEVTDVLLTWGERVWK
ncbi:unnamed protein product [Orchesella dallaii]|uniref:FAD synthase n=1 Tax=Orchesella dallaii TaxID=48710 RepID=A0ABP1QFR9_9HEXA